MVPFATDEQLPPEQAAIWLRCRHPSGAFAEFAREDIEQPLAARFERIAALHANKIAIKAENRSLTYSELDCASDCAAATMLERNRKQSPALLLFEQGPDVVVAILGALKAGKPYVVVSPSFPSERISTILKDCEAATFVTNSLNLRFAATLRRNEDWLNLDEMEATSFDKDGVAPTPDTIATILYTSGSTGRPKGVVQTHRGMMHRAMVYTNMLRVCADDRLTLLHAPGFGSGIHHLFSALLNGATLYPFDASVSGAPSMSRWLAREKITLYHSAPSLFRELAAALTGEAFPDLRVMSLTGAPIFADDVQLYKKHFSEHGILVHLMGANEAGWIRRYAIDKTSPIPEGAVPVGYSIEEKNISLIDESGRDAPPGEIGEIAVRSRYLAHGYWNNPGLTADKFIPAASGETIYRTGDLGRFAADQCLFHAGRKDFLTKIRGFRVEPGEIETALRGLGSVNEAAVIALTRGQETELVAYVVLRAGASSTFSTLRRRLAEKLPDYMIPKFFVLLDALPLTPNGKVDRKALPDPSRARPLIDTAYVPPATSSEKQLVQIWSDAFGYDAVGIHDDFVELGGHSLLAARIAVKVQEVFGVELSVRQLLDAGTITGLARVIPEARAEVNCPDSADEEIDEI